MDVQAIGAGFRAGPERVGRPSAEERPVVADDEAEFLALGGGRRRHSPDPRLSPDFALAEAAQGKAGPLKLSLSQGPEEIALVLRFIAGRQQAEAPRPRVRRDPRVVSSCHGISVPRKSSLEKGAELDFTIADDAGAWGPPGLVLAGKVSDDAPSEFVLVVQEIVRDAEPAGYLPRHSSR